MYRFFVAVVLTSWPSIVAAQSNSDDPYALPRSAVTGWPNFYKPLKVHPHDQLYYAMGWCRTNHYHYTPADLVDIDTLEEVSQRGQVVELRDAGTIAWFDGADRPIAVHVHPDATAMLVRGPVPRRLLKLGEFVRFVGQVSADGNATSPVDRVEIVAPPAPGSLPAITIDAPTTIIGKLVRVRRDELTLVVESDVLRRVAVALAPHVAIEVASSELRWTAPGSRLAVEGRVYRADSRIPADQVFATALEIRLPGSKDFSAADLAALASRKRTAGFSPANPGSPGETLATRPTAQ